MKLRYNSSHTVHLHEVFDVLLVDLGDLAAVLVAIRLLLHHVCDFLSLSQLISVNKNE